MKKYSIRFHPIRASKLISAGQMILNMHIQEKLIVPFLCFLSITIFQIFVPVFAEDSDLKSSTKKAFELYAAGDINGAREIFENNVRDVQRQKNSDLIWNSLINAAWFESEVANYGRSITLANQALNIGLKEKNDYQIGKSLDWLGWAYSALGRYEAATGFYSKALTIAAPKGQPVLVDVWGLALQELGAIYFKMGDIKSARESLETTLSYARAHDITIGVAEGAAELAEVELSTGSLDKAEKLALESIEAATRCNCSPNNLSSSKVTLAGVLLKKAELKNESSTNALPYIEDALNQAIKTHNIPTVAEAKLLLSRTIPQSEFQKRFDLLSSAYELLESTSNEMRGKAEASMGAELINKNPEQADFYLKHGIKVNKEMLRLVDKAYILLDVNRLKNALGETEKANAALFKSLDLARGADDQSLVADISESLASQCLHAGLYKNAFEYASIAENSLNILIQRNNDQKIEEELNRRLTKVKENQIELAIRLGNYPSETAVPESGYLAEIAQ